MRMTSESIDVNENSFELLTETDLLACFRKKDLKKVLLPQKMQYPRYVQHYFSWIDSSGSYAYLVFKKKNWYMPKGIVFRRGSTSTPSTGRLCNWCHAYGPSDQIGSLSVKVNAKLSVGLLVCNDISCLHKLETVSNQTGKDIDLLIHQMCHRMGLFFENTILAPGEDSE